MLLDRRLSADRERGRAELPLVRAERVEQARVGHQRSEQLIVDHVEMERPRRCAGRFERERQWDRARAGAKAAGDGCRAVLRERADHVAGARQLHRRVQARKNCIDVGAGHRKFGRPEVVHRVAERVDAIAVDVRHGPGTAKLQIAADQHDADRVARLQRTVERLLALAEAGRAGAARYEALILEGAADNVGDVGLEACHDHRRGDRAQHGPELAAGEPCYGAHAFEARVAGTVGERTIPVERLAERRHERVARQRVLDVDAGTWRPHVGQERRVGHLRDRRDAGDRLLRKAAERVRHGADQAAVDVDRAAAHAGDDAGVGERSAFELGENQVAVRPDDVLEDADDVGLEFFDVRAVEYGATDADHAGPDVVHAHLGAAPDSAAEQARPSTTTARVNKSRRIGMGSILVIPGEVLAGQGEMGDRVDTDRRGLLSSRL